MMDPQRHASLLRQCGVTWYVLRDPAVGVPSLPRCMVARPITEAGRAPSLERSPLLAELEPPPADYPEPPPIEYDDSMVPEEAAAASPSAARRLLEETLPPASRGARERSVVEPPPSRTTTGPAPKAEPAAAPAAALAAAPFHLLVVAYENAALFVCAIKSARLSPAWEQSARGFLDDVVRAITRADPPTPRLDYFSWPMAGKPGRAPPRGDAEEVTSGFLQGLRQNSRAPRVFLLCESAHRHAAVFAGMDQRAVTQTHGLGEFFTRPQLKADLWALLRQGA